jgi:alanine dehydrogenase
MTEMVLVLTKTDLQEILPIREVIDAVEEGFREFALGNVRMPSRPLVDLPNRRGLLTVMPAYIGGGMDALGVKIVTLYPDNPSKFELPSVLGTVLLNDSKSGDLLAIMEGTYITAMRTAACSAVATKYLARKDAKTVGIFGCGVQGRTHLMAMCKVREIERAKAYDMFPEYRDRYCKDMSKELDVDVIPCDKPKDVVKGSDIIVTVTTSKNPVFKGEWLEDGVHINAVGAHAPDAREVDDLAVKRARRIVVDWREAVLKEGGGAGEIVIPITKNLVSEKDIVELGDLIIGKKPGRSNVNEITLFKTVGLAIEDVSTAIKAYELAKDRGVGKTLTLQG